MNDVMALLALFFRDQIVTFICTPYKIIDSRNVIKYTHYEYGLISKQNITTYNVTVRKIHL